MAPLWALSLISNSPTHSTNGVVAKLMLSAFLVVVASAFDQGSKNSNFKN
jgi:hypothetical protein